MLCTHQCLKVTSANAVIWCSISVVLPCFAVIAYLMVQYGSKHQRLICAHTGTSTFIPYVLPIPGTHVCAPKKNRFSEHFTRWNKYPSVHVQLIPSSFLGCAKKIGDGFRVRSLSHCNRLLVIWSICVRYQCHCRQQITLSCHSIVVTT